MAEIAIDRTTFPAEGGEFTINITKDDPWAWGIVTIPDAAWYTVLSDKTGEVSAYLYKVVVDVTANKGSTRTMSIGVSGDGHSELFTIQQPGASSLSADIIAYTAGNVASGGGQVTVDVYSNGGNDNLSTAAVSSGSGYCSRTSTTHGVTSGGYTCTRFVFTFTENTATTTRNATFAFTVSNGSTTASTTLTKTQAGQIVIGGTMSVSDAGATSAAGSQNLAISTSQMQTATIAVSGSTGWLTSAAVQIVNNALVLVLTYPANTASAARSQEITLSGTDNYGNTVTTSMTLTQQGTTAPTNRFTNIYWESTSPRSADQIYDYMGGNERIILAFAGMWTGSTQVSYPATSGLTVTRLSDTQFRVNYAGGSRDESLVVPFTFSRAYSGGVAYAYASLTLTAGGVFPIWRDTFGTIVTDADWEDYELQEDEQTFYQGRAFAYPDEQDIRVNVSRVVAPYLTGYFKDVDFVAGGEVLASYTFVRDYSYDPSKDYTQNLVLNAPINGKVPSGVLLSASMWGAGNGGSLVVEDESGSLVVNNALVKGLNTGNWVSGSVGKVYTIGDESYRVVDACRGALLKYVNAYGAVDFFLVEGVAKKSDKITRATYEKDAAALSSDYEGRDYQNEMVAEWTGTTGWLTDEQSLRMKHLVESVEVYMIDKQTGLEIPVQMTDNNLQHKTFDTNGRRMVNYSLAWKESQKKIRR